MIEFFVTLIDDWKLLTNTKMTYILDSAGVPDTEAGVQRCF